jgi:predicted nuclease with TOPRIM domain
MQPLLEKLSELQAENTGLRDCNDELTVEVESLTAKLASLKTKKYVGDVQYSFNEKCFLV